MGQCRVCGREFPKKPLLRYENMPMAAQSLPDAQSLGSDRGVDLEVHQCAGCGLVQLAGEPVPYYRDVIRAAGISPEMQDFRCRQFGEFVRRFGLAGKKVVEIGCGRGEYLSIMQQCGVRAYGLEHAEASVKHCKAAGLRAIQGFVESGDYWLDEGPFDAFFCLTFLEHLPRPNASLAGIGNILAPGGVGLVDVPNFDMILRKKLFSEFIADHLFYFTKDTLETTLQINGFEVLDCSEQWHDYLISAIIKKRGALDLSHASEHMTQLRAGIESYIRRFAAGRVAVWGAGHQALAVIALLGLADKIRYVVDSAPFKQGKFTPATHLPIVPPETLDSDPVDAVIVMAASYCDEVAGILKQHFQEKLHIALLRDFGLEIV
jgi:SAM-dependent methyltransferase